MKIHLLIAFVIILLCSQLVAPASATAIFSSSTLAPVATSYYAAPQAVGAGNCSDWNNACTLAHALLMPESAVEIWLKEGIHVPEPVDPLSPRDATFTLRGGTQIFGSFEGDETSLTQRDWMNKFTILSSDLAGDNDTQYER
jgi:hypothetical protein